MSTVSLYQKYRPQSFSEVVGQGYVVTTLTNQLKNNNVSHAYLFYGTRGLGKTTVARILAKSLNISSEDLYEIDAASNRGIDDIREIRDAVNNKPFSSEYKMYLIDEVHMLTKEAFNALLKTIEEPPEYVVFVLATTELHKVPDTIKSRTQIFTFKQPDESAVVSLLGRVNDLESGGLDSDQIKQIAKNSGGSYRDALTSLQLYLANPNFEDTDTDNLISVVMDQIEGRAIAPETIEQIIKTQNPEYLYTQLVQAITDKLKNKVTQADSATSITSADLKRVLDSRRYFSFSDVTVERAALVMLMDHFNRE